MQNTQQMGVQQPSTQQGAVQQQQQQGQTTKPAQAGTPITDWASI